MSMGAAIRKLRELRETHGGEWICITADKMPNNQINRILGTDFQNIMYCGVYYIWGNGRKTGAEEHFLEIYIVSNDRFYCFEKKGMSEEEILKDRYFEFVLAYFFNIDAKKNIKYQKLILRNYQI